MTTKETVQVLKENARALRSISTRRTVVRSDEDDLKLVASNLESLAIELQIAPRRTTTAPPKDTP